jgi:hypothetical protein
MPQFSKPMVAARSARTRILGSIGRRGYAETASDREDGGLLSAEGQLAKSGWGWVIVALIPYCLLWVMITIKREISRKSPCAAALVRSNLRIIHRLL